MSVARALTARPLVRRRIAGGRRASSPARPRRARRAAAGVVVGAVAFLAVQLATDQAIRHEWVGLQDPLYHDKFDVLRGHPAFFAPPAPDRPTTVLAVGSSRTLNALDAGALGPDLTARVGRPVVAFNFGVAGAGPVTSAVYLRRLLAAGVKPDAVLVEVHPAMLAGQGPRPPELDWLAPIRLRPDEPPLVRGFGLPVLPTPAHGLRGRLAPWYEYRYVLAHTYAPGLVGGFKLNDGHEPDRFGFHRQDEADPADVPRMHAFVYQTYARSTAGFRPTGPGARAVEDVLGRCRAAGVRAALVICPESTAFRGWYDPAGLGELDALLARWAREYAAPVVDGRAWLPDPLVPDGHHTTGAGADAFTARLAGTLAPWFQEFAAPSGAAAP